MPHDPRKVTAPVARIVPTVAHAAPSISSPDCGGLYKAVRRGDRKCRARVEDFLYGPSHLVPEKVGRQGQDSDLRGTEPFPIIGRAVSAAHPPWRVSSF